MRRGATCGQVITSAASVMYGCVVDVVAFSSSLVMRRSECIVPSAGSSSARLHKTGPSLAQVRYFTLNKLSSRECIITHRAPGGLVLFFFRTLPWSRLLRRSAVHHGRAEIPLCRSLSSWCLTTVAHRCMALKVLESSPSGRCAPGSEFRFGSVGVYCPGWCLVSLTTTSTQYFVRLIVAFLSVRVCFRTCMSRFLRFLLGV